MTSGETQMSKSGWDLIWMTWDCRNPRWVWVLEFSIIHSQCFFALTSKVMCFIKGGARRMGLKGQ